MNGFIEVPSLNRRFPYVFQDDTLTVYSADSLPLNTPTAIDISSSNEFLIGTETGTNSLVVFFVDHLPFEGEGPVLWSSTTSRVYYYIDGLNEERLFAPDKLCVSFDELNYFFNINFGMKRSFSEDGTTIETIPYENTKKNFSFSCKDTIITGELGIIQVLRWNSTVPLELHNQLSFSFEATTNIDFLRTLYAVAKKLFCILCYRRNIQIDSVELYGTNEEGRRCSMGVLHPLYSNCTYAEDKKVQEKTVKYYTLESHLPELIQAIADDQVYTEHIPETRRDGRTITVARTILITAAFEWTFKQTYGNPPLSAYRQEVKADILELLETLPEKKAYNSKKKGEVKLYQGIVSRVDRNLSEKIQCALNDCNPILEPFIKLLYAINDMEVATYAQIADGLQYQRNAYAHGEIDRELRDDIILDVIILEWLNYCMLFKQVGYDEVDIFNAINQIFNRGFMDRKREAEAE